MALLAAAVYDPSSAGSFSTASLAAMTAIDTTNLRVTFTAPANGIVLTRIRCTVHGATTVPQCLLGVLDGSTVKGRAAPLTNRDPSSASNQHWWDATIIITGLTPSTSYTWDAACGVELAVASSAIKYGGPNDTTTNNAFGAFSFEVWETTNLLAATHYDPGTAVTNKSVASNIAVTAFDTTNLRLTFTAPSSGRVLAHIRAPMSGSTSTGMVHLGVLEGATVRGRVHPNGGANEATKAATSQYVVDGTFVVTGLTPGNSYSWDAAYAVDLVAASENFKYGGPNNTTQDDAWGGVAFDVWAA